MPAAAQNLTSPSFKSCLQSSFWNLPADQSESLKVFTFQRRQQRHSLADTFIKIVANTQTQGMSKFILSNSKTPTSYSYFRFCFLPLGKSLGLRTTSNLPPPHNPILEKRFQAIQNRSASVNRCVFAMFVRT